MLIPEFSENGEKTITLYFPLDGKDPTAMQNELEKTYVCFSKMNVVVKNAKKYLALEIENEE